MGICPAEQEDGLLLKLIHNEKTDEQEVDIRYAHMTSEIERVASFIRNMNVSVKCRTEDGECYISAADIYYVESVDKKSFVYCREKVYQTDYRLYELEEELRGNGFVRISKSCILNIEVLQAIRPLLNSRLEASLLNGEKVFISRKYLSEVKNILQRRQGL